MFALKSIERFLVTYSFRLFNYRPIISRVGMFLKVGRYTMTTVNRTRTVYNFYYHELVTCNNSTDEVPSPLYESSVGINFLIPHSDFQSDEA